MQQSLFVFLLMGRCFLLVCGLYDYHFIDQNKTWEEAQRFCRQNFTDLAKVSDMDDMKRLHEQNQGEAWIGLRNHSDANRTWFWSQPEVDFVNESWANNEPNDNDKPENCVRLDADDDDDDNKRFVWNDIPCSKEYKFICYNDTDKESHISDHSRSWLEAQNFCRGTYTDLISGTQQLDELKKKLKKEQDESDGWWIGLFRDRWIWSDGSNSSFRNWEDEAKKGCALVQANGKWSSDDCDEEKPFFCYDDKMILIRQKETWFKALEFCRDRNLDLVSITNPQQQNQVQQRVQEAGGTNVWLGLRYTCTMDLWFWVSDNLVCYENWNQGSKAGEEDGCYRAAVMNREGKWEKKSESDLFHFICAAK